MPTLQAKYKVATQKSLWKLPEFNIDAPEQAIQLKQCNLLKEMENKKTNDPIKFKNLSGIDLYLLKYMHRQNSTLCLRTSKRIPFYVFKFKKKTVEGVGLKSPPSPNKSRTNPGSGSHYKVQLLNFKQQGSSCNTTLKHLFTTRIFIT